MIQVDIPDLGILGFNEEDVPVDYCWPGYCSSMDEFKERNFLIQDFNGHKILICSNENGVALGNYLSGCIVTDYMGELEVFISNSMSYDYWFCMAFEYCENYDQLEDWVKDIIELFIQKKAIIPIPEGKRDYFALVDTYEYEDGNCPDDIEAGVKKICEAEIINRFLNWYEWYDSDKKVEHYEGSFPSQSWADRVVEDFIGDGKELAFPWEQVLKDFVLDRTEDGFAFKIRKQ